jgi:hypothetical protein
MQRHMLWVRHLFSMDLKGINFGLQKFSTTLRIAFYRHEAPSRSTVTKHRHEAPSRSTVTKHRLDRYCRYDRRYSKITGRDLPRVCD